MLGSSSNSGSASILTLTFGSISEVAVSLPRVFDSEVSIFDVSVEILLRFETTEFLGSPSVAILSLYFSSIGSLMIVDESESESSSLLAGEGMD